LKHPLLRARRRIAFAWVVALLGTALAAQGPPQQPVFRSGVELVEVDVVALNEDGRPVRDLRQEEFRVYEDGVEREIVSFAIVGLPVHGLRTPTYTNVSSNAGAADARVVFLILDDVNSLEKSTEAIRAAARELVMRLGPDDRIGLVWASTRKEGARELTTDHATVLASIEQVTGRIREIQARSGFRSIVPRLDPVEGQSEMATPSAIGNQPIDRFFARLSPYQIVIQVSRAVASLPNRRKAVVYIGEWMRPLGDGRMESNSHEWIDLQRAVTAARRANVSVYLLDPRSPLRPGSEDLFEPRDRSDLDRLRRGDIEAFTEVTGGFTAATPLIAEQIHRIVSDLSTYYLLGYYADPPAPAGPLGRLRALVDRWHGFRTIEVRTTRPGVSVRARRGYWPIRESDVKDRADAPPIASREAWTSVTGAVPRGDFPLGATAAAFRGRGNKHPVVVAVEIEAPGLANRGPSSPPFRDELTLAVFAYEPGSRVRATQTVRVKIGLDAGRAGPADGRYIIGARVDLSPGQYHLRMGVRSADAGTTASVYHDLSVPDFSRQPLSMSHIVLARSSDGRAPLVARSRAITAVTPFIPSLVRELSPNDDTIAMARVYRTRAGRSDDVLIETTVTALESGETVWADEVPAVFSAAGEAEHRLMLPLGELEEGSYRLAFTAMSAGGHRVERFVDFRRTEGHEGR
jgi:VWFA-related protein